MKEYYGKKGIKKARQDHGSGNKFSGEIAPALKNLEKNGIIRVIDLVFVLKDTKGKVLITEAKNLGGDAGGAFSAFAKKASEWFSLDDIEAIATVLPKNLLNSGAVLVDQGRIPSEVIRKVEQGLIKKGGD